MRCDAVIVGGGVIGLAVAWRSAQRGLAVAVVDSGRPGGASEASAGMLTPVSELNYGDETLLRLGLESQARYAAFVTELEEETSHDTAFRRNGVLEVAFDADDLAALENLRRFQVALGVPVEALSGRECRELEPRLAPAVLGGMLTTEDGSIDPRRLTIALRTAVLRRGGSLVPGRATEVIVEDDVAVGVRVAGHDEVRATRVVLATGCWTREIGGIPPEVLPPVRPVKGQILRLRASAPILTRCVRRVVRDAPIYLIPRADGELVVGSTEEEVGYDTAVTAGGVWRLLRSAGELLPGVTELEFAEADVGLRPGSPDNAPLLGPTDLAGLYVSTGHFRNGVLLTAITGDVMAETLVSGRLPETAVPFAAHRFQEGQRQFTHWPQCPQ